MKYTSIFCYIYPSVRSQPWPPLGLEPTTAIFATFKVEKYFNYSEYLPLFELSLFYEYSYQLAQFAEDQNCFRFDIPPKSKESYWPDFLFVEYCLFMKLELKLSSGCSGECSWLFL